MSRNLKNIIIHLRFPFSFLLMPVYFFALSQAETVNAFHAGVVFFVLHALVYPSSNGYNSYADNDKGSIGGIRNPPIVPEMMLQVTLAMDIFSIMLTWFLIRPGVALLILLYILASRAYSFRGIRLKKYPVIGFLTVALFQGPVAYVISSWAGNNEFIFEARTLMSLLISFLLIGAGYPLTQIYQHKQDKDDGVKTLSILLGIKGTFIFSATLFGLLGIVMVVYLFIFQNGISDIVLFVLSISPVVVFFIIWMNKTFLDEKYADFLHTMRMSKTGAFSVNIFFLLLIIKASAVLE